VSWTEAAFSACLAWHWPDHHWQCNRRAAWRSSHVCTGKRRTLRATVTIFSHMTRDVSVLVRCDTILRFVLEITTNSNFQLLQGNAAIHWTCGGKYYSMALLEIYFSFQQWKNVENPLRIDKVIAMSLVYYFLRHSANGYERIAIFDQYLALSRNTDKAIIIMEEK